MRDRVIFLIGRLIPSLLGLVVAAALTRMLDPVEYGTYALGLSIIFFLTIGIFEWLGLSVMRMAPATKEPTLFFGTVMTCFSALFGLCATVIGLILLLGEAGSYAWLMIASLFASFFSGWFELKQRLHMAELRATEYFRMSVGRGILTVVLVCVTTYVWRNVYLSLSALGLSFWLATLLVREQRLTFGRCKFDVAILCTLFRFGLPLSVSVGLGTILLSVDRWLLQALSGSEAVGYFTAATLVAQMPILAFANGLGPTAYSMAVRALESRSRTVVNAQLAHNFIVLLGIVVPGAAGTIALSENLAHFVVGRYYWASVVSLTPWLSAAAVIVSIRAFYVDIAFQLANRTSPLIWLALLAVAANVALDIWLVPRLGELGAAIGSFNALLFSLIVATIYSRRVFLLPVPLVDTAKVLVSSGVMFLVLHKLAWWSGVWALAWQIAAGTLTYAALIVVFNVMNVRECLTRRLPQLRRRIAPSR